MCASKNLTVDVGQKRSQMPDKKESSIKLMPVENSSSLNDDLEKDISFDKFIRVFRCFASSEQIYVIFLKLFIGWQTSLSFICISRHLQVCKRHRAKVKPRPWSKLILGITIRLLFFKRCRARIARRHART